MSGSTEIFIGFDSKGSFVCIVYEADNKLKEIYSEYGITLKTGDYVFSSIAEEGNVKVFPDMETAFEFSRNEVGAIRFI